MRRWTVGGVIRTVSVALGIGSAGILLGVATTQQAIAAPSAGCAIIQGGGANLAGQPPATVTINTTFNAGEIITGTISAGVTNSLFTIGAGTIFNGNVGPANGTLTIGATGPAQIQVDIRGVGTLTATCTEPVVVVPPVVVPPGPPVPVAGSVPTFIDGALGDLDDREIHRVNTGFEGIFTDENSARRNPKCPVPRNRDEFFSLLGQYHVDARRHNAQFNADGRLIGKDFDRFELVRLLCVRDALLKSPFASGAEVDTLAGENALSIYDDAIAIQPSPYPTRRQSVFDQPAAPDPFAEKRNPRCPPPGSRQEFEIMLVQYNADARLHNEQFDLSGKLIGKDFDRFELVRLLCVRDVLLKSPYQTGSDIIGGVEGEYALSIFDDAVAVQVPYFGPPDPSLKFDYSSRFREDGSVVRRSSAYTVTGTVLVLGNLPGTTIAPTIGFTVGTSTSTQNVPVATLTSTTVGLDLFLATNVSTFNVGGYLGYELGAHHVDVSGVTSDFLTHTLKAGGTVQGTFAVGDFLISPAGTVLFQVRHRNDTVDTANATIPGSDTIAFDLTAGATLSRAFYLPEQDLMLTPFISGNLVINTSTTTPALGAGAFPADAFKLQVSGGMKIEVSNGITGSLQADFTGGGTSSGFGVSASFKAPIETLFNEDPNMGLPNPMDTFFISR